jgi:hypothetical protein
VGRWAALLLVVGCSSEAGVDAGRDAGSDGGRDAGRDAGPPDPCGLFGTPNERTGLDAQRCRPSCACGGEVFVPRAWGEAALSSLRAYVLEEPPALRPSDPYEQAAPDLDPDLACAVVITDPTMRSYRLETFASLDAARAAGAIPTHTGPCGLCSSLTDLAVYAGTPDLTAPVRQCGIENLGDFEGLRACLEALGFTPACAQIWAFNTEHTRAECGATCIRLLDAPYHLPDGGLNECLACDEERSGPVFKAVAGRTRRNSGLANAMCRPCSEVVPFAHDYP